MSPLLGYAVWPFFKNHWLNRRETGFILGLPWTASPFAEISLCKWPTQDNSFRVWCSLGVMSANSDPKPERWKQQFGTITQSLWERRLLWNTGVSETEAEKQLENPHWVPLTAALKSDLSRVQTPVVLLWWGGSATLGTSLTISELSFCHLWKEGL